MIEEVHKGWTSSVPFTIHACVQYDDYFCQNLHSILSKICVDISRTDGAICIAQSIVDVGEILCRKVQARRGQSPDRSKLMSPDHCILQSIIPRVSFTQWQIYNLPKLNRIFSNLMMLAIIYYLPMRIIIPCSKTKIGFVGWLVFVFIQTNWQ